MDQNTPPPTKKQKKQFQFQFNRSQGDGANLFRQRCNLPIYSARAKLITEIRKASSSIVIGETGSGKTTQIPQYLLEAGVSKGRVIACTQPRRVAATSIAARVASEVGVNLGDKVGYSVRFDDMTSPQTKLKFMTDGMLLREAILDPLLSRYSIIILDEAHERTVHTDVLFGIVKAAQKQRQSEQSQYLKIVVMSATMDVDHFSKYFSNAPVLYVQGRQHPIQIMYSSQPLSDYMYSALVTIFQIHQEYPVNEDILVFLTGQEEIEGAVRAVTDVAKDLPSDVPGVTVCRLYAALPQYQQMKVFKRAPLGKRKVILSTNIAETSITIPGIKHVVDTGRVKAKSYIPGSGVDLLKVQWVSQAQAWQRTGRAGRENSGTCWRLYTEDTFAKLPANTVPEIQRSNLANVVLQLLALNVRDVLNFDFMDPPSKEMLKAAIGQLKLLGAVEVTEDELKLTPLGRKMVIFPLDPRLSKVILSASNHGCLEEMLTIVSLLSVDSVTHAPPSKREQAAQAWQKFSSSDGDHIMLLTIYRSFKAVKGERDWCMENFIHWKIMKQAMEIRKQLRELCVTAMLDIQSCGRDTAAIRKCLVQGMFMNAAELQADGRYLTLDHKQTVIIHPSSCLFNCKPSYVLYNELVQTSKSYLSPEWDFVLTIVLICILELIFPCLRVFTKVKIIVSIVQNNLRNVCAVDPEWLYETAPEYFRQRFVKR